MSTDGLRTAPGHIRQIAAGRYLRDVITRVPRVLLPIPLAGPGPSGSADPSRLCQGCSHPHPAPSGAGCPQLHRPATTGSAVAVSHLHSNISASWRTDAQIKLSVVASDIFGVSGRPMLAALLAGQRDPKALAALARRQLRGRTGALEEAFTGYFTDHHAALLSKMLARIDGLSSDIADLDAMIEELIAPFAHAVARLDEIPGIARTAAAAILAESGSPGALPHRGPLRTVRAPPRRTRLKQAARALRVEVPASCVGGRAARGGRRRGSSGFGSHPSCPSRRGGRGVRRRSPCVPRPATSVPSPRGTGVGRG